MGSPSTTTEVWNTVVGGDFRGCPVVWGVCGGFAWIGVGSEVGLAGERPTTGHARLLSRELLGGLPLD